ncbi:hypothetical protein [Spirosoma validum]|uniref:Uncharacterized protein n=1 Tax=Spirosoma validum TaxID=2771355 RepID=A0A927B478_9BACT|nr:hypothetical protein [Spirosoma validum]MBD2755084.1 hypothetical protein [Spirosoma validum]
MNTSGQWVAMLTEDEDDYLFWQYGFKAWAAHFRLEWFATGNAFFERQALQQNRPGALLLNGLIPLSEEPNWLAKILKHVCCQGLNVIILADLFPDDQRQMYMSLGAVECMILPTTQRELEQAVRKIIAYTNSNLTELE